MQTRLGVFLKRDEVVPERRYVSSGMLGSSCSRRKSLLNPVDDGSKDVVAFFPKLGDRLETLQSRRNLDRESFRGNAVVGKKADQGAGVGEGLLERIGRRGIRLSMYEPLGAQPGENRERELDALQAKRVNEEFRG